MQEYETVKINPKFEPGETTGRFPDLYLKQTSIAI